MQGGNVGAGGMAVGTGGTAVGTGGTAVGTGGAGGSGGAVPPICGWTSTTSNATCPAGPCPILLDEQLTCAGSAVVWSAVSAAPAVDATWVVASTTAELFVHRLTATEQRRVDGVPEGFAGRIPLVALASDGTLHLAADTSNVIYPEGQTTYVGGVTHAALSNGVWSWSIVLPNVDGNGIAVRDLQIGSDGVPRLWLISSPFTSYSLAKPSGNEWTLAPAPLPAGAITGWNDGRDRFTLGADGSIVSLALEDAPPGERLYALVGGAARTVGSVVSWGDTQPGTPSYAVTTAPMPAAPGGALFAAALADNTGIHVVGESASAPETEILVPGTQPPAPTCPTPDFSSCSGTCHETGVGVQYGAFALAWTDDGVAWLTYVVTQFDQMIEFLPYGSQDGPPETCQNYPTQDASQATLHLVRVTLDGQPATEVLSMPVDPPDIHSERFVEMRAFAKDLAIGLRTSSGVRVLRLDTMKL